MENPRLSSITGEAHLVVRGVNYISMLLDGHNTDLNVASYLVPNAR